MLVPGPLWRAGIHPIAVLPPGMLCLGLEQGWELAGAELLVPTWPKHCVLGSFQKSLCHPQDRDSLHGGSIPGQGRLGCLWVQLGCAVPERAGEGVKLGQRGQGCSGNLQGQHLDGGSGGALAGCPHQQGEGTHPSASWACWGGTALHGPEHPGVGVPRMDGIPGMDAVLAIIWGLLPTVQG